MILLAATLAFTAPSDFQPIALDGTLCHPQNLLVKLDSEQGWRSIQAVGATVMTTIDEIGWAVVRVPAGKLQATKKQLTDAPGIQNCTLDRAAKPAYTPNDPKWSDLWHMRQIKADLAWDTSLGTKQAIVAVLDTGVAINHEDLAANIFTNNKEIAGNGIDDDANGYIDDVHGYDFAYGDNDPNDVYGHGTGCAGLVAAVGDNAIGITGVAPKARILPIKVSIDSGYFYDSATVPAYIYAANIGARVFSMSYYSDRVSQAEEDALIYASQKGVIPVAAAGNDYSVFPYYPAGYDCVVSVAATDGNNNKAGFSNYGWSVDVAAPGVGLTTTSKSGGYMGFSGTSGACPHVAGLFALLKGSYPTTAKTFLRNAVEDTSTLLSWDFSSHGLVNAQAAMGVVQSGIPAAHHAPKVKFVSPFGYYTGAGTAPIGRVFGRNLEGAKVKVGGVDAVVTKTTRDSAYFQLNNGSGTITVEDSLGNVIAAYDPPMPGKYVWPMNEASFPGVGVIGGFAQTLRPDGNVMSCDRRSDGNFELQMSFRKLPKTGALKINLKRSYIGGTAGTEKLQLYRWASASYPYGPFDDLATNTLPTASSTLVITIPDIAPYVDFEGTAYLRIYTTGAPAGSSLEVDAAYFKR
ncbi:MAG TPA: S8 family peptidase [Fimbriimonas sp.]|nr:S8 family peptidase [Fimbriimonas sp.]